MSWCKITAIVRRFGLEQVERRLEALGVPGITVTEVHGFGEYKDLFRHDWTVTHARLEIFTPRKDADRFVHAILEAASTGEAGDGIVALVPVESVIRIRDGSPARARDAGTAEEL
ncbi:MAG TPA: P-II family nitrogen regulator [Gemmatimonadaceae bacterium]|jgi:nitrogen regulatory protein P-II 1